MRSISCSNTKRQRRQSSRVQTWVEYTWYSLYCVMVAGVVVATGGCGLTYIEFGPAYIVGGSIVDYCLRHSNLGRLAFCPPTASYRTAATSVLMSKKKDRNNDSDNKDEQMNQENKNKKIKWLEGFGWFRPECGQEQEYDPYFSRVGSRSYL
eukprot:scaffold25842_cov198-Amphora_coffeaeformis.AAC.6